MHSWINCGLCFVADNLSHIDQAIGNGLDNKNKLLHEMVELFGKEDASQSKVRQKNEL